MKKTLFQIVALILAILMMATVFAGCASKEKEKSDIDQPLASNTDSEEEEEISPQVIVRNSLLNFLQGVQERDGLLPFISAFQKGSVEFQMNFDAETVYKSIFDESYPGELAELSLGGKLFFDKSAFFFKDLSVYVNLPTENIDVNLNADLYCSADYAYFSAAEIFGEEVCGIIRGESAGKLENSAWASQIPAEKYELIGALIEAYDNGMLGESSKDLKERFIHYLTKMGTSIEKNAEYVVENKLVSVGGEDIDSRVVTLTIDKTAAGSILEELYEELKNDTELRDLVVEYCKYILGLLPTEEIDNIEDLWDDMLETLDKAVNDVEGSLSADALIIEIVTPDKETILRKFTLSFEENGKTETGIVLDVGRNGIQNANRIALSMVDYELVYEITENSENAYKANLKVTVPTYDYGEKVGEQSKTVKTVFDLSIDHNEDTFELTIPDPDTGISYVVLCGIWNAQDGYTVITVNSVTYADETLTNGFDLTLILDEDDPMTGFLNKDQVANLLDFSEADTQRMIGELETALGNLFAKIFSNEK